MSLWSDDYITTTKLKWYDYIYMIPLYIIILIFYILLLPTSFFLYVVNQFFRQ